jgi:hypothetical protein
MTMNIEWFLSIAGAALGSLGVVAALCTQRAVRGWRARCLSLESSLAALRRELELAASIGLETGRRVEHNEQECSAVADRVAQLELRGAAQSFDQAIDSARRGADPGKLARQFGLSSGEADLVSRLHGRQKIA